MGFWSAVIRKDGNPGGYLAMIFLVALTVGVMSEIVQVLMTKPWFQKIIESIAQ